MDRRDIRAESPVDKSRGFMTAVSVNPGRRRSTRHRLLSGCDHQWRPVVASLFDRNCLLEVEGMAAIWNE